MFLNIGLYLELKKFIEDNNYICPNTNKWLELFHLLQVAPVHNKELNLEVPYLQDKWDTSSVSEKRARFYEQLEFGFKNGNMVEVDKFLRSLKDGEWLKG